MAVIRNRIVRSKTPKKKKPKLYAGVWTQAKYFQFIRSALRQAFQRYPAKQQAKMQNRRNKPPRKKGKHKYEYQCAACEQWFMDKEVQVDHITPAGSLKDYKDLPGFTKRLFCEPEDLQILCIPCHQQKTNRERKRR